MRKKRILIAAGIIIVALLGAGIWWLFNTGRLVYVSQDTKSQGTDAICGPAIVDEYNAAMYFTWRKELSKASIDEVGINNLATKIKAKTGYESDATCQTILFWTAEHNKDYKGTLAAYEALKNLHDKGMFADSNLRSTEPLFTFERYVKILAPANTRTKEDGGE